MDDKSPDPEPDLGEGIHSIGDMMTVRQRRRFKSGDVLAGRYKILGELGQGGMGLVFRCLDEVGGIEVAVKMLPPEVSHDSGEMEEVRENFQLVAGLAHPNIATVRTLERDPATGEFYLVMELAEGSNLRHWRKKGPGGRRPLAEALPLLRQVASALDYAHSRKVIHRDVKPSNVMISPEGTAKVLDFGLAAQIHTSFSRVSHVRYGTSGTGPYMAPEQWRGQYQDARTDQYAMAVMAYEMLSGKCPFEGADMSILRAAVLEEPPARPEGLGDAAWAALQTALHKNREARFASCADFVRALEGAPVPSAQPPPVQRPAAAPAPQAARPAAARPPAPARPAAPAPGSRALAIVVVVLAVLGLAAGAIYLVVRAVAPAVAPAPAPAPVAVTPPVATAPSNAAPARPAPAPTEAELATRRAYEAARAAASAARPPQVAAVTNAVREPVVAARPVEPAPVAPAAPVAAPRGGLRVSGPADTEVWSGEKLLGRANSDIAGLAVGDLLLELRSPSRGKLTLFVSIPTNDVLQVRAPWPDEGAAASSSIAAAWDARRGAAPSAKPAPTPAAVNPASAWNAAVARRGRETPASTSVPAAAGSIALGRKDQLYAMGQWYLFWPGDDNDVYLWYRDKSRALEIVGDSNGWWKRRDGSQGYCVFSNASEKEQAFYDEPWTTADPRRAVSAPSGSFVLNGKHGGTKFVYDGTTITITLTDGGTLTVRASGRAVEFRDYNRKIQRYN